MMRPNGRDEVTIAAKEERSSDSKKPNKLSKKFCRQVGGVIKVKEHTKDSEQNRVGREGALGNTIHIRIGMESKLLNLHINAIMSKYFRIMKKLKFFESVIDYLLSSIIIYKNESSYTVYN